MRHTIEEVQAAEAACDMEALWKLMTQGGCDSVCWAAESARGRIERVQEGALRAHGQRVLAGRASAVARIQAAEART